MGLRDSSELVPGQEYVICDYTYVVPEELEGYFSTQGFIYEIKCIAISPSAIYEKVKVESAYGFFNQTAIDHDGYYFKAEVWYTLDNDNVKYPWCSVNGKGVIYRIIDEYHNDIPYDYWNILINLQAILDNELVDGDFLELPVFCNTFMTYDNSLGYISTYPNNNLTYNTIKINSTAIPFNIFVNYAHNIKLQDSFFNVFYKHRNGYELHNIDVVKSEKNIFISKSYLIYIKVCMSNSNIIISDNSIHTELNTITHCFDCIVHGENNVYASCCNFNNILSYPSIREMFSEITGRTLHALKYSTISTGPGKVFVGCDLYSAHIGKFPSKNSDTSASSDYYMINQSDLTVDTSTGYDTYIGSDKEGNICARCNAFTIV